jgi:hypothetical protein
MSRRFAMRLAQAVLVVVLGLWVHTTGALAIDYCTGGACHKCPWSWHGSCYAGLEGCGYYGCWDDGQCQEGSITVNQCYCDPCEAQ